MTSYSTFILYPVAKFCKVRICLPNLSFKSKFFSYPPKFVQSFALKEVFIIFCNLTIITQVISGYMTFE
jgi:hypothetical protein